MWKKKKKTKRPDAGDTSHSVLVKIMEAGIKYCLLIEEEFIRNQEQMKPLEEKREEERSKIDDLREIPMPVGTSEEIFDDSHTIVSASVGSELYVSVLLFVYRDLLESGCLVPINHKAHAMIEVLMDNMDPLITVTKVEKSL